jgi:hypothetical protein
LKAGYRSGVVTEGGVARPKAVWRVTRSRN